MKFSWFKLIFSYISLRRGRLNLYEHYLPKLISIRLQLNTAIFFNAALHVHLPDWSISHTSLQFLEFFPLPLLFLLVIFPTFILIFQKY
jgi:hypothetical protein